MLHQPVMPEETLRLLAPASGEWFADGTVGLGGHAAEILGRLGPEGFLIGCDLDTEALGHARARLEAIGANFRLFAGAYTTLPGCIRQIGRAPEAALDGLLLDLGVSSLQLDSAGRGFSFQKDGPLDMRMDASHGESAADYIRRASVQELHDVLKRRGEERAARRIARAIVEERGRRPITTTRDLAEIVERLEPRRGARLHPATRTFLAIRLVVNQELECLEGFLRNVDRYLRPRGRIAVLAYHSLEDRIVKRVLGEGVRQGLLRWRTDRPLRPGSEEVAANPRARSARLRVAERVGPETSPSREAAPRSGKRSDEKGR